MASPIARSLGGVAAALALGWAAQAQGGIGADAVAQDAEPETAPPISIGVMPQRPIEQGETDAIVDAGIDSVRIWLAWSRVESERGSFDWGQVDDAVRANAEAGLGTLPFLFGTPEWAAERDGRDCEEAECIPYPPASAQTRYAFAQFAAAAVRRYGPAGTFWAQHPALDPEPVRVWQVWNEPNLSSFWSPRVDPSGYASLLAATAEEIRARDPGAEILIGGLTGKVTNSRRMSARDFLDGLYAVPEVSASFDGIAVHPYDRNARGVIGQVRTARDAVTHHGDDAPIWVTEIGWASKGKRRLGLVKTLAGQARRLERSFNWLTGKAESWGIRAAYWYSWRDTERGKPVCSWCPASGLVGRDGKQKPAYRAMQRIARG